ncbi:MAG: class I SAM-dependent methyltransferase [Chitinophagaceae bacterium]|nr:MAG: class I SAM-dependent methyltransferase [Chitinophagaceae bacterium]
MNKLREYFENNESNAMNKWMHYFDIYDRHLNKYVGKDITILEIGVFQGGSLKMWKEYFGDNVKIYAIDIYEKCKQFEEENVKIFIGSQSDRDFLRYVKTQMPPIDILIDDGGHYMDQQIVTFEELYDHIKPNGTYLCEDLHTSYWNNYGGGYKRPESFIEYSKEFIDKLHAWHSWDEKLQIDKFTRSTYSLHYYDSILVLEKKEMSQPESKIKGKVILEIDQFPENIERRQKELENSNQNLNKPKEGFAIKNLIKRAINKLSSLF